MHRRLGSRVEAGIRSTPDKALDGATGRDERSCPFCRWRPRSGCWIQVKVRPEVRGITEAVRCRTADIIDAANGRAKRHVLADQHDLGSLEHVERGRCYGNGYHLQMDLVIRQAHYETYLLGGGTLRQHSAGNQCDQDHRKKQRYDETTMHDSSSQRN